MFNKRQREEWRNKEKKDLKVKTETEREGEEAHWPEAESSPSWPPRCKDMLSSFVKETHTHTQPRGSTHTYTDACSRHRTFSEPCWLTEERTVCFTEALLKSSYRQWELPPVRALLTWWKPNQRRRRRSSLIYYLMAVAHDSVGTITVKPN